MKNRTNKIKEILLNLKSNLKQSWNGKDIKDVIIIIRVAKSQGMEMHLLCKLNH